MRTFFIPILVSLTFSVSHGKEGCNIPEDKPNIVIIMADDLGYGDLQCYGSGKILTPSCDRIAREGMLFTDAHSPSAVCSPTRYGLLTGTYAWRSWMKNWVLMEHMPLLIDKETLTIQQLLKNHGYVTGCVGKWHLGWGEEINPDWNGELKPGPLETGFDYFFGVPFSHNSSPHLRVFVENRNIVGLKEGENIYDKDVQQRVMRKLDETAINLTSKAIDFIKNNKGAPFLLYFPTTNVHAPHTPNPIFKSEFGTYGAFVKEFDWIVGRISETLKEEGLENNTLLIITSDNGAKNEWGVNGHLPNGNLMGAKGEIYEGGHRVPFMVRWPGKIKAGKKTDITICHTDILSTIAGILNIEIPEGPALDSYDYSDILSGKNNSNFQRAPVIHHSVAGMFAIRDREWKLIEGLGNGFPVDWPKTNASGQGKPVRDPVTSKFEDLLYYFPPFPEPGAGEPQGQLYNLRNDPSEMENLYCEHAEEVTRLREKLQYELSRLP